MKNSTEKNRKMTNFQNTFKVFLWKVRKQKAFHWFKNALFTLLPIILVVINFLVLYEDETARRVTERSEPVSEVSTVPRLLTTQKKSFFLFTTAKRKCLITIERAHAVDCWYAKCKQLKTLILQETLRDQTPSNLNDRIYFAPNTDFTANLMEKLRMELDIIDERVEGVNTEADLRPIIDEKENFFAVVFHISPDSDATPSNLSYTIRSKNNNFRTHEIYNGDVFGANNKGKCRERRLFFFGFH